MSLTVFLLMKWVSLSSFMVDDKFYCRHCSAFLFSPFTWHIYFLHFLTHSFALHFFLKNCIALFPKNTVSRDFCRKNKSEKHLQTVNTYNSRCKLHFVYRHDVYNRKIFSGKTCRLLEAFALPNTRTARVKRICNVIVWQ